jgi:hypothetical protein
MKVGSDERNLFFLFDGCCTSFCFFSFVVAIASPPAVRTLVRGDGGGDDSGRVGPYSSDFEKGTMPREVIYLGGVPFSWDEVFRVLLCSPWHSRYPCQG